MRNRLLLPVIIVLLIILTSCQLPLGKLTAALDTTSLCGLSSSARVSSLTVDDTAARKKIAIPSKFVDKDVTVRFNHLICDQAASDKEVYIDNIMFLDAQGNCLGNNCPIEVCNNADDDDDTQKDEGLDPNTCQCANGGSPANEVCNTKDDNCDGTIDGNTENCYTGTAGTNGVGLCHGGTKTCTSGQWGGCAGGIVPVSEVCNTKDDDCNGQIDENNACAVATVPEPDAKWLFLNDVTESQANIPTISHNQEFSEKAVTFETRANWNAMKITSDDSQRSRSSYAYVDYQNAIPEQRNRLDPTDALTVEGWVWNDQDWGWNSWQTVFAKVQEYSGVNPESYALFITPEISLHFVITTDDGGRRYFNTPKDLIQWQKWSHFAVTYDKNAHQVQIFVNGIRVYNLQSGSLSQPLQVKTHNLYFGFRDSSNENDMVPFNGALRDIRLYKRALTPAQVLARYRVYVPEIVLCAENKVGDDVCDEQKHLICIYPEGQGGEGLCNSDGNVRCICGGRYLYREGCADGYSDADGNLYNGCEAHI